jgi:hypothetical protein
MQHRHLIFSKQSCVWCLWGQFNVSPLLCQSLHLRQIKLNVRQGFAGWVRCEQCSINIYYLVSNPVLYAYGACSIPLHYFVYCLNLQQIKVNSSKNFIGWVKVWTLRHRHLIFSKQSCVYVNGPCSMFSSLLFAIYICDK